MDGIFDGKNFSTHTGDAPDKLASPQLASMEALSELYDKLTASLPPNRAVFRVEGVTQYVRDGDRLYMERSRATALLAYIRRLAATGMLANEGRTFGGLEITPVDQAWLDARAEAISRGMGDGDASPIPKMPAP